MQNEYNIKTNLDKPGYHCKQRRDI